MNYTRLEYDLDQIASKGSGNIAYRVVGYRDRDVVELQIRRARYDKEYNGRLWNLNATFSSYVSRDSEQESNDLTAMENCIAALQDACLLGREIEKQTERMEALFQAAEAVRKAEAERIAAEKKAAYDADPAVGEKLAKHIIKQMAYEIKAKDGSSWDEISIQLASRGERKAQQLNVRFARAGLTLFTLGYYRISKAKALAMLADSAIDGLKVDGINIVDPKLAKFMMV